MVAGQIKVKDTKFDYIDNNSDERQFEGTLLATLTFYPDAHVESTSVDGYTQNQPAGQFSWAELIAGAGTSANDAGASLLVVNIYSHPTTENCWGGLGRALLLFDISSIPSGKVATSATLTLNGSGKTETFTVSIAADVNIYSSSPASDTAIVAGDFDSLGSIAYCDTPISYADWAIGTQPNPNNFVLNTAGLDALNASIEGDGIFRIGTRNANYDVSGSPPAWEVNKLVDINSWSADKTGDWRPSLVVTYATSPGTPGIIKVKGTYFHYIDNSGYERRIEGTDTTVNGTAGTIKVIGTNFTYVDNNGDERSIEGTAV